MLKILKVFQNDTTQSECPKNSLILSIKNRFDLPTRCLLQVHARAGIHRQSSVPPFLFPGLVDIYSSGEQKGRSKFTGRAHDDVNDE